MFTIKIHSEDIEKYYQFKSECSKCSGLCCVALFFSKIDGFPEDKTAGKACVNLEKNFKCMIHNDLETKRMRGCIGYDCFGAGNYVTQYIYDGISWQDNLDESDEIFDVFVQVYYLHQMRYFLIEALPIVQAEKLQQEEAKAPLYKIEKLEKLENDVKRLIDENIEICNLPVDDILDINIEHCQKSVNKVLKQVCALFLKPVKSDNTNCFTDYIGKKFVNKDFNDCDFNTKLLIAADFTGCSFEGAAFLGTDTRDTNFSGADLSQAIFLNQGQVNAAKGSRATKLPAHLEYPVTWK